jgi:hypothetical protein
VTLEIVVDERPLAALSEKAAVTVSIPIESPREEIFVRVEFSETELRQQVKAAGGRWNAERKMWRLTRAQASALGLSARIEKDG